MRHWMAIALASSIAMACASKTVTQTEPAAPPRAQPEVVAVEEEVVVTEVGPTLPATASPFELVGLLSLGALGAGLGVGRLRRRAS